MKKSLFFLLALAIVNICSAGVVNAQIRRISENGKISGNSSAVLNGNDAFVIQNKLSGAQTILIEAEYTKTPAGIILSRNRQQDRFRGYELGFCEKNGHDMNGELLGGSVSAGTRQDLENFLFKDTPKLQAGGKYTFIWRFIPEKSLDIFVVDRKKNELIFSKNISVENISSIADGAGNGLLIVGGRRSNSKSVVHTAPAGTAFSRITIWDNALSDEEIAKIANVASLKISAKKENVPTEKTVKKNLAPTVIHVNAELGKDSNKGTKNSPLRTIQSAVDKVNPGDTVLIAPGVYFETVKISRPGRADQPIVLKADGKPGSVVITSADKKIRTGQAKWECVDDNLQLYRTKFTHSPCRMLYSGVDLFPYNSLDELKNFKVRHVRTGKNTEGAKKGIIDLPAAYHGFYFDDKSGDLYVRLHAEGKYGSRNPADHVVAVGAITAPGGNGHHIGSPSHCNLFIDCGKDANYFLDGLTFETPGAAGVITKSGKVVMRNCFFKGCRFGAWSSGETVGVFIENCHYDQAHAYWDAIEVITKNHTPELAKEFPSYHWTRKRNYKNSRKLVNYETGIAGGAGRYWHIRNCDVVDTFEGLSTWGMSNTKSWRVYGNNMQRHVDNAIEAENHACDLRIHNNLFADIFEPMSYQPNAGMPWPGPVFVYRNVFYNNPEVKPLLSVLGDYHGTFKMGIPGISWNRLQMNWHKPDNSDIECRFTKKVIFVPYPGYMVFNNTILLKEHALLSLPMPVNTRFLANVRFFNNVIETHDLASRPMWDGGLMEFYRNAVVKSPAKENTSAKMTENKGTMYNSADELKINKDFTLSQSSPLLDKGSLGFREPDASVDLGAVHRKGKFQLVTGPGKAVDVSKLSLFRQKVFYNAEMLRSEGPISGEWAVYYVSGTPVYPDRNKKVPYIFDGQPIVVDLGSTRKADALTIVFRAADNKGTLLKLDKAVIGFTRKGNTVTVTKEISRKKENIASFKATRDEYVTVRFSEKATCVNGKKAGSPCNIKAQKCQVIVGYNPIFDVIAD